MVRYSNIVTLRDLCKCRKMDLLGSLRLGNRSVAELENFLYEQGLHFDMKFDEEKGGIL